MRRIVLPSRVAPKRSPRCAQVWSQREASSGWDDEYDEYAEEGGGVGYRRRQSDGPVRLAHHPHHDAFRGRGRGRGHDDENPKDENEKNKKTKNIVSTRDTIIFGLAWRKDHLVACTSRGTILIWNIPTPAFGDHEYDDDDDEDDEDDDDDEEYENDDEYFKIRNEYEKNVGKKRRRIAENQTPDLCIRVSMGVLYNIGFVKGKGSSCLLLVSGDDGIMSFRWNHVVEALEETSRRHPSSSSPTTTRRDDTTKTTSSSTITTMTKKKKKGAAAAAKATDIVDLTPLETYAPHKSPFCAKIEINSFDVASSWSSSSSSSSADDTQDPYHGHSSHDYLFGAAGDAFGCYKWDLETSKLLSTYRSIGGIGIGGGYLHKVRVFDERHLLMGGEDGHVGMYDFRQDQPIVSFDVVRSSSSSSSSSELRRRQNHHHHHRGFGFGTSGFHASSSDDPSSSLSSFMSVHRAQLWISDISRGNEHGHGSAGIGGCDHQPQWFSVCGGIELTTTTTMTTTTTGRACAVTATPPTSHSGGGSGAGTAGNHIHNNNTRAMTAGGFLATFHVPTRTMVSSVLTRETPHRIMRMDDPYHDDHDDHDPLPPPQQPHRPRRRPRPRQQMGTSTMTTMTNNQFVTVANEGVITVWSQHPTLQRERRLWSSPPCSYALAGRRCVHNYSDIDDDDDDDDETRNDNHYHYGHHHAIQLAVAGVGSVVDLFASGTPGGGNGNGDGRDDLYKVRSLSSSLF